eukprot:ANDGO_05155.mRNA.1 Protein-lysine methyltransferase C42C1.13
MASYRDREISFFGKNLTITQRFGGELGDHIVWDAALVLCSYLEEKIPKEYYRGKSVLELGSGCGTVSLALAQCEQTCFISATDQAPLIELIQKNIDQNPLNKPGDPSSPLVSIRAEELEWPSADSEEEKARVTQWLTVHAFAPFELVLMSDCVYPSRNEWIKLLWMMRYIADAFPDVLFLMSHELRSSEDALFFVEAQDFFVVERVPKEEIPILYQCDEIALLRFYKKKANVSEVESLFR